MARGGRSGRERERRRSGALVGNSADVAQVANAGRVEEQGREQELADLAQVLGTPEGRRTIWRIMEFGRPFSSAFSTNTNEMSYLSGRQDVARWLIAEVEEAEPEAFGQMMQEARLARAAESERAISMRTNRSSVTEEATTEEE